MMLIVKMVNVTILKMEMEMEFGLMELMRLFHGSKSRAYCKQNLISLSKLLLSLMEDKVSDIFQTIRISKSFGTLFL